MSNLPTLVTLGIGVVITSLFGMMIGAATSNQIAKKAKHPKLWGYGRGGYGRGLFGK